MAQTPTKTNLFSIIAFMSLMILSAFTKVLAVSESYLPVKNADDKPAREIIKPISKQMIVSVQKSFFVNLKIWIG